MKDITSTQVSQSVANGANYDQSEECFGFNNIKKNKEKWKHD
jgi:hypothetical protein